MTPDLNELNWFKSSYSDAGNDCVETAFHGEYVFVRDAKNRDGEALRFTRSEWNAFLRGARDGEFDLPA